MPVVSGSASASKSKSTTTTKTSGERSLDATEVVKRFDDASKAQLDDLLANLMTKVKATPEQAKALEATFGKAAAIKDSAGAVQDAIRTTLEMEIPKILDLQNRTGAYNATTAQLLADNAGAMAAQKGAVVQLDTIQKYQTLLQGARQQDIGEAGQNLEAVLSTLQLERDATAVSTREEDETGSSQSTSKSVGSSVSASASATY